MKDFFVGLLIMSVTLTAMAQKPSKPKLASTPSGMSYLGDNPATITNDPAYHRAKKPKKNAASAPQTGSPQK